VQDTSVIFRIAFPYDTLFMQKLITTFKTYNAAVMYFIRQALLAEKVTSQCLWTVVWKGREMSWLWPISWNHLAGLTERNNEIRSSIHHRQRRQMDSSRNILSQRQLSQFKTQRMSWILPAFHFLVWFHSLQRMNAPVTHGCVGWLTDKIMSRYTWISFALRDKQSFLLSSIVPSHGPTWVILPAFDWKFSPK
jgi:hypothetical protein